MDWDFNNVRQFFGQPRKSYWNALPAPKRNLRRRALVIGIDHYEKAPPLKGCIADAREMARVLSNHGAGANGNQTANFECRLLISEPQGEPITSTLLKREWLHLFEDPNGPGKKFDGNIVFYFSGHGAVNEYGGHLVTQEVEATDADLGFEMEHLILLANRHSAANSVTMIIDACHSGEAGNSGGDDGLVRIKKGISILAASLPTEFAMEVDGRGVFTRLVVGALEGGGADVLGNVSPASIFAYAEAALGPQEQRPMYKAHASDWEVLRRVKPEVSIGELAQLHEYFPSTHFEHPFDPEYEHTELEKFERGEKSMINAPDGLTETRRKEIADKIAIFKLFKRYQVAGLLEPNKELLAQHKPENENDLYWAALCSVPVRLTRLGQYYRQLAEKKLIRN